MKKPGFYVDTCIWLNLFKKEGDASKGKPYWEIAKEFIELVMKRGFQLFISHFVIKELRFKLEDEAYQFAERYLKDNKIRIIKVIAADYDLGRDLESRFDHNLSFGDCMHMAISKRFGLELITRDKELLRKAKTIVPASRPETIISQWPDVQTPY